MSNHPERNHVTEAGDHLTVVERGLSMLPGGQCPQCNGVADRNRHQYEILFNGLLLCRACADKSPLGPESIRLHDAYRAVLDEIWGDLREKGAEIGRLQDNAYAATREAEQLARKLERGTVNAACVIPMIPQ